MKDTRRATRPAIIRWYEWGRAGKDTGRTRRGRIGITDDGRTERDLSSAGANVVLRKVVA